MTAAVTGAFGYTGKAITHRLLAAGAPVITLTNRQDSTETFNGPLTVLPLNFDQPDQLRANLAGVKVLYNTYWVRFAYGGVTFDQAVRNSQVLFAAAFQAGVERIVHISVSNPSADSPLPYFRGKAQVETALQASGVSYAILRPTLIFGKGDILINNIAFLLRRLPFFAIPGSGRYRLQPVYMGDLVEAALQAGENREVFTRDVIGPELFSFNALVRAIRDAIQSRAILVHVPPRLALAMVGLIGNLTHDRILTRDELSGLMDNLLTSPQRPNGATTLVGWLDENAEGLGRTYANELNRHFRNR